jgi:urea transport system ATP-binding protein
MLIGHQPKEFLLAVESLTVSFDGFKAVNDLSFYVEENEIRVIIGPNGAGKTTVLDLICGKTRATSGSIQFRGQELTKLKENQIVQAGVGRKFQTPSVFEDLTVFENLEISFPRLAHLSARRDGEGARRGSCGDDLPEGPPRYLCRSIEPRPEAMA